MELAPSVGLRFVALNRRDYPSSTPIFKAEIDELHPIPDGESYEWHRLRGLQYATFISNFVKENGIPPISQDGKEGGVALVGWSLGSTYAIAPLAYVDTYPPQLQAFLKQYVRGLILQGESILSSSVRYIDSSSTTDPPEVALGIPLNALCWSPGLTDSKVTATKSVDVFWSWCSAFFDHGDLSGHDETLIEYIVPSVYTPPTIYQMSREDIERTCVAVPPHSYDVQFLARHQIERAAA